MPCQNDETLDPCTTAVRAGIESDTSHGAVTPPLHLSSNFTFAGFGQPRTYDYSRSGNPTRAELERALAQLEGGAGATCTASGMASCTLALHAFAMCKARRVVAQHDCYGGTHRLICSLEEAGLLEVVWLDLTGAEASSHIEAAKPDLVWIETPSNPLLRVVDVRSLAEAARRVGAKTLVDNTFLSPALQNPIALGADLVLHSTTKSINGHSDVVGGALVAATEEDAAQVAWWANNLGLSQSPFDTFLTLRGLRTLHARWAVHEKNALRIARCLKAHPAVAKVYYPGLESHPGHALAKSQQRGFGAIVSFEVCGGLEGAKQAVEGFQLFCLAESLGGVESLVAHPATMTHAAMHAQAREEAGITEGLLRLAIGIEDGDALEADLMNALSRVSFAAPTRLASHAA